MIIANTSWSGNVLKHFVSIIDAGFGFSIFMSQTIELSNLLFSSVDIVSRFKDSAESETSRPSRIRLGPLRDESESRVGRLSSEETDSAENRS